VKSKLRLACQASVNTNLSAQSQIFIKQSHPLSVMATLKASRPLNIKYYMQRESPIHKSINNIDINNIFYKTPPPRRDIHLDLTFIILHTLGREMRHYVREHLSRCRHNHLICHIMLMEPRSLMLCRCSTQGGRSLRAPSFSTFPCPAS
jgi:hypothetical protein